MKNFAAFFAILCMATFCAEAQTTVTIGTGTSESYLYGPTYISSATSTFKYSRHAAIYTADEISAGGVQANSLITHIRWYRADNVGGYTASNGEFKIYVKGIDFDQHTGTKTWDTEVDGATLVYSSTDQNINTTQGWQEFELETPFLWNGTDNIEVFTDWYRPSNAVGRTDWRYTSTTNPTRYQNAYSGGSTLRTTVTRTTARPNIQFDMIPAIPAEYESSTVTQITGNVVRGESNYRIIRLAVTTSGFIDPLKLTKINFNTNGTTNTADLSAAKIYYTGTSSTFNTNTLYGEVSNPSGDHSITANRELLQGTNYFWLTYNIDANATPGNVVDGEVVSFELDQDNVTTTYYPSGTTTGNRTIISRLSGNFTIGAGGNYETLADAFAEINVAGLEGNATFNIISDLNETDIPALTQRPETGGSFTLTIRPSGGAYTITGNQPNGLIMFDGADRVVIDGSVNGSGNNLTLVNNFSGAAVVRVNGPTATAGSNEITIRNTNIIAGSNTSTTTYGISVLGLDNDDLTLENNTISRASTGIIVRGSSTSAKHDRMDIIGNTIGSSSASDHVLLRGIDVQYVGNGVISQNQVMNMLPTSSTTLAAIELGQNVTNTEVTRNKIHNIKNPSTGGAYGINISTSTGNSNNIVANNFVSGVSTSGNGTSTVSNAFGIRIAGGSGHEVYYNTVNMSGNFGGTSGLSSALLISSGSGINVRNNILTNDISASGAGPRSFAIYTTLSSPFSVIDYNNYDVSGSNVGILGYKAGTEAATLDEWRVLTGQDANSVSKSVSYINALAGDLHLSEVDTVLAKGIDLSTQLIDIDGETRKNTYIGADEVLPTIVITTQPASRAVCVGSNLVIQSAATVDFNAVLSYEWRRNGIPLFDNQTYSGTETPVLTITNAQPGDAGIYVLTVFTNSGTELESSQATIIVNSPITFETQPESVLACLNENIQFSVPVDGTITGYQWQKAIPGGYMDLPGETAAGLNLNNVDFTTSGKYRLLVFGGCSGFDTVSSNEVRIFVIPQNNLVSEPEDVIGSTSNSATFTAEAYGGPSASFQWYKGTQPLVDNERISGSKSSVLTISNLQLSDAGSDYSVQVQGRCGTGSSRQVTLSVIEPNIFITQQPVSDTVCVGSSVTFATAAESSIAGAELTYRWMKDGVTMVDGGEISGATTSNLMLTNITKADTGVYTVEVTTVGGAPITSTEARLTVAATPEINVQPVSSGVCENGFLELSVSADAIGATYQWKFNGTDIPGAITDKHLIQDATPADVGMYSVTITNQCGSVTSSEANVTFNTKPTVTAQPEPNVNLNQGESFTLSVTAAGSGTLAYQWMKDDVEIVGATGATYTVTNANKAEHMGAYKVKVINECGVVTSNESVVDIVSGINDEGSVAGVVLEPNQPNPFSETTAIRFTLPQAMFVTITIMDIHGREIAVLANGFENAGTHTVTVNAAERNIPAGVYMYTMTTGSGYSKTKQLVIIK